MNKGIDKDVGTLYHYEGTDSYKYVIGISDIVKDDTDPIIQEATDLIREMISLNFDDIVDNGIEKINLDPDIYCGTYFIYNFSGKVKNSHDLSKFQLDEVKA